MSRPYGPIPLTAGIVTSQDIDGVSGAWIVIRNDSISLDLGVSFQVNPPAAVAVFSGRPWEGVIPAGGSGTFKLPDDTIWRGRIWLCPVDVSGLQAASGTTSGYSRAYVRVFDLGEDPQTESSVVRALDLVSQPRIINIPAANQQWHAVNNTLPGAPGRLLSPNPFVISVSAANLNNGNTHAYLTNYRFSLTANATSWAQIKVQWAILDAGLAQISSIDLFTFRVDAIPGGAIFYCPNEFQYQDDLMLVFSTGIPPNAAFVALDHYMTAGTAVGQGYNIFASWWVDLVNAHPIAQPGNQTLHQAPGTIF